MWTQWEEVSTGLCLSCASLNCDYKQETEIQVKPPQTPASPGHC